MRELTFKGFLSQYVKQLSLQDTCSLYKLAAEASENNPRLREPLLLYAIFYEKQSILLQATKNPSLHFVYQSMTSAYDANAMTELFLTQSPALPNEYHKVWRSYLCQKNRCQADNHTKELMRQKVRRLQMQNGITNYRIYTNLKLNPGNLNAWLKYGDGSKVSLETARKTLHYVETQPN